MEEKKKVYISAHQGFCSGVFILCCDWHLLSIWPRRRHGPDVLNENLLPNGLSLGDRGTARRWLWCQFRGVLKCEVKGLLTAGSRWSVTLKNKRQHKPSPEVKVNNRDDSDKTFSSEIRVLNLLMRWSEEQVRRTLRATPTNYINTPNKSHTGEGGGRRNHEERRQWQHKNTWFGLEKSCLAFFSFYFLPQTRT